MLKLYENIKRRRTELQISQTALAELVGYSEKSMISRIEHGKIDIPQSKIELFAKALHTTPGDLMGAVGYEEDTIALLGKLNEEGKEKVYDYVSDLVASGRYALQYGQSEVV